MLFIFDENFAEFRLVREVVHFFRITFEIIKLRLKADIMNVFVATIPLHKSARCYSSTMILTKDDALIVVFCGGSIE